MPTKLKLSEAIRLGSMVTEPDKYCLLSVGIDAFGAKVDLACALGAAYIAGGVVKNIGSSRSQICFRPEIDHEKLRSMWPFLNTMIVSLPIVPENPFISLGLGYIITKLNDKYYWSREQIADWVERIEKEYNLYQEEPITEESTATEVVCRNCLVRQEPIESCINCGEPIEEAIEV